MKFREHDNLKPLVLTAYSGCYLEEQITEVGRKYNIIDLQFSTAVTVSGDIHYSALLLINKKEGVKNGNFATKIS